MTMLRVIPGTPELVPFLMERLPAEERALLCEPHGFEVVQASMVDLMRQAARTWCGMDAGGVVFIAVAVRLEGLDGVRLLHWETPAISLHRRACIVAGRRIAAEAEAAFGCVTVNVAACDNQVLRASRAGFSLVEAPRDVRGVGLFCRCTRSINQGSYVHG